MWIVRRFQILLFFMLKSHHEVTLQEYRLYTMGKRVQATGSFTTYFRQPLVFLQSTSYVFYNKSCQHSYYLDQSI